MMRCYYKIAGGHVHCRIFGPGAGKTGNLVFRKGQEFRTFVDLVNWNFFPDDEDTSMELACQD